MAQMREGKLKYELDALDSLVGFVDRGIYAMHAVAAEAPPYGSDAAAIGALLT